MHGQKNIKFSVIIFTITNFNPLGDKSEISNDREATMLITTAIQFVLSILTPWRRVLLEKLTGSQLLKKSPSFYGTRKFITAFTSVRHQSLS